MIILEKQIIDYLDSLIYKLFEAEYFGFVESSENYVNNIIDFIFDNMYTFPHQQAPKQLRSFGSNYIFYKTNQRTTWYIFFETNGTDYFITNIINNNCEEAKWL
ncbi:MAG: hypothetical protein RLZZ312_813 [Bacteroidota bacterium]|jgi:CCR4-NOT transcriptional regulation complex NOT5 subunit